MKLQRLWQLLGNLFGGFIIITLPIQAETTESLNLLIEMRGDVQVKRSGWKKYQKATPDQILSSNDRIQLGPKASARVFCSDLTIWEVPPGRVSRISDGCPPGVATLTKPNSTRKPTRAIVSLALPDLISPRNTRLLERKPIVLRWQDIKSPPYQVTVTGGDVNWTAEVNEATAIFPADQQPIEQGFRYQVKIQAKNGKESDDLNPASFAFLEDAQAKEVQKYTDRIKQLKLDTGTEVLILGFLYQKYDLKAEAIDFLEAYISNGQPSTASMELLGMLYQQSGLLILARDRYSSALTLAKKESNLEGQAILQSHLGEVHRALAELKPSLMAFQEAKRLYQELGDTSRATMLQKEITDLQERIP